MKLVVTFEIAGDVAPLQGLSVGDTLHEALCATIYQTTMNSDMLPDAALAWLGDNVIDVLVGE